MTAPDWNSFPHGNGARANGSAFDAVIIGSGLGGLSCAAAFAKQGFRALVLEQHDKPGGYATSFKRPGGFEFDVSLHSMVARERDGVHNLIPGFPEISDVEFLPHPNLYRVILPDFDIRVPQRNGQGYIAELARHFPREMDGIDGLIGDMTAIAEEIHQISAVPNPEDIFSFSRDFPHLSKSSRMTWARMVDTRIGDPKLKVILSSFWGYFGLPPSRIASFFYAMPMMEYLREGGYYAKGRSQKLSNAFVEFIEGHGGVVRLNSRVNNILVSDGAAYGVRTADGNEFAGRVIVSNASAHDTFERMLDEENLPRSFLAKMSRHSVSLSSFQLFLGLKEDLVGKLAIPDSEVFIADSYDMDADYEAAQRADVETCGSCVTLFDNVHNYYSPEGKNTINVTALQGFDHWKKFETDYFNRDKIEYRREKKRMADLLIGRVEKRLIPGLSDAIEVIEIGTPLTNLRFTSNFRGAVYGWDQTLSNSGHTRVPHGNPIQNLFLAGAWSKPGHGYNGVIHSGLSCFGEIMKGWKA